MDWNEAGEWLGAAVIIAGIILLPRWFSFRQRAIAGAILFPLGWAGIFIGLAVGDRPFMQSEAVAYTWVGVCAFAVALGIVLLVPVFREWRRKNRRPRRTTERWRAGYRKH
jgi:hypothetical protein